MCFIAGCINIPNLIFFSSEQYAKHSDERKALPIALRASAMCTDTSWEPCPTCSSGALVSEDRIAFASVGGKVLPFILKNNCAISDQVGYVTAITILFVLVAMLYFIYLQYKKALVIDRSMQTSRDYSIEVEVSREGYFMQKLYFIIYIHFSSEPSC